MKNNRWLYILALLVTVITFTSCDTPETVTENTINSAVELDVASQQQEDFIDS